jgi:ribosomal protein S18 acetylase RimI-like enzyme
MNIVIERAKAQDAAEIIELSKIIGSESDNLSFDKNGIPVTVEEEAEVLAKLENSDKEAHFVARKDSKIVGWIHYTVCPKKRMAHRGEFGICVKKSENGKGIGSMLLRHILEFAKETCHSEVVSLEVRSDNYGAIALYKKFGFEKIGTFKGFFKIDGELVDFDIMQKFLD